MRWKKQREEHRRKKKELVSEKNITIQSKKGKTKRTRDLFSHILLYIKI
jgi:hypothetical protein